MRPFDLQVNGYAGVDFCAADLTADEVHAACERLVADGVDGILATLITDSIDSLVAKLQNWVQIRDRDPLVKQIVAGFHIEGPFLNSSPGYIGAHPPNEVVPANVDDTKQLLDAANGLTKLITLAPENDPNYATTRFLSDQGITVSAGHCDPTLDELRGAIDHGLSMVTHFGNGCPVQIARHDNFLQRALHLRDDLWICFIPDGAHVEFFALKNYLDLVGVDKTVMVTDAISASTLGPGLYEISGMTVEVDEYGTARKPGSKNLAGSTITMPGVINNLKQQLDFDASDITTMIVSNPRKAIGLPS